VNSKIERLEIKIKKAQEKAAKARGDRKTKYSKEVEDLRDDLEVEKAKAAGKTFKVVKMEKAMRALNKQLAREKDDRKKKRIQKEVDQLQDKLDREARRAEEREKAKAAEEARIAAKKAKAAERKAAREAQNKK
jgi:hypothetical protein